PPNDPVKLRLDHGVALARDRFEAGAIDDGYPTTPGGDDPAGLKVLCSPAHGGLARTEQTAQELVGDGELVGGEAIAAGQQPARETFCRGVQPVARHSLGELVEDGPEIVVHDLRSEE